MIVKLGPQGDSDIVVRLKETIAIQRAMIEYQAETIRKYQRKERS